MEFYKVIYQQGQYQLEEEAGQDGTVLDNGLLSRLAALLYSCYQQQDQLPLTFRRYLTAYYASGEMEYIALAEASSLLKKPLLDGFATTWLEGEEENRVWIGADGAVENRGPSAEKVKTILQALLQAMNQEQTQIKI